MTARILGNCAVHAFLVAMLGSATSLVALPCSALAQAAQPQAAQSQASEPKASAPAGVPADKAQQAPPGGTSAVVMDLSAIESVIGKSVKSSAGEDLGRIVDLLVTTTGQVRAAVIDFGGVLGVGSRKVAVDWKALDFASFTKDGTVHLALTRNQVRVSPEYKSGDPVVILQAAKPDDQKPQDTKSQDTKPQDVKPQAKAAEPLAGERPQTPGLDAKAQPTGSPSATKGDARKQ